MTLTKMIQVGPRVGSIQVTRKKVERGMTEDDFHQSSRLVKKGELCERRDNEG